MKCSKMISLSCKLWWILPLVSCNHATNREISSDLRGLTPVTVTHPYRGTLTDAVNLNATSIFQVKTDVKSDINGYITRIDIQQGQKVNRRDELFIIRSKEAEHLGNTITQLDTSFRFSGINTVRAPVTGYVSQLSHAVNDYVQDGESLVTISDLSSLVFVLDLPYDLKPFLSLNKTVKLTLPGGEMIEGNPGVPYPVVDPASQTLSCIIHIRKGISVPENLIASVRYVTHSRSNAVIVPREAVLTNEVQDAFWIMRMSDSVTAVKVPVKKGLESADKIEILSPALSASDLILISGNYGLPDTALVVMEKQK